MRLGSDLVHMGRDPPQGGPGDEQDPCRTPKTQVNQGLITTRGFHRSPMVTTCALHRIRAGLLAR